MKKFDLYLLTISILLMSYSLANNINLGSMHKQENINEIKYIISSDVCLMCKHTNKKIISNSKNINIYLVEKEKEKIIELFGSIPTDLPVVVMKNGYIISGNDNVNNYINNKDKENISDKEKIPTFAGVIGTAFVDSVNICAINCLIFIITLLNSRGKGILKAGIAYIMSVFISYTAIGLFIILTSNRILRLPKLYNIVGVLILIILSIGIYKSFKKLLSKNEPLCEGGVCRIDFEDKSKIELFIEKLLLSNGSLILTGVFIAVSEFACSGMMYIPTLLLINNNIDRYLLLLIYNLIFITPLIVTVIAYKKIFGILNKYKDSKKLIIFYLITLIVLTIITFNVYF